MLFVQVRSVHVQGLTSLRYTPDDWRLDVLDTHACAMCGEPAAFYGSASAECLRCGYWCDGLVAGLRQPERFRPPE